MSDKDADFFLDILCFCSAFVAGQYLGVLSFMENFFWANVFFFLLYSLRWLCKIGFALVKRKFGKEK